MSERIGITTTIPVEVVYAAGFSPVDLNNLFISSPNPEEYIFRAEQWGMPPGACAWTKGIYAAARLHEITRIICVVEGDCANTRALMERWQLDGVEVIPFAYPHDGDRARLRGELWRLAGAIQAPWEKIPRVKDRLDRIRKHVWRLDELTWRERVISSEENHYWQVSCSDFCGCPDRFEEGVRRLLKNAKRRKSSTDRIRIGYMGVPPIVSGLYRELESIGFAVVFNEVQRQFSMPYETRDIIEQYLTFTYPYGIFNRVKDSAAEIERRDIRGVIHYVQSFCHRGIEDYIIREKLNVPVLTLEYDRPGPCDERTRIRLEAFYEMLQQQ